MKKKGVETVDDAINGALDIISETVSDDADLRKKLYAEYTGHALIVSKKPPMKKLKPFIRIIMITASLRVRYLRTDFSHLTEENVRMRSRSASSRKNSML